MIVVIMSAADVVATIAVDVLFPGVGSAVSALTVAVFASDDPFREGSSLMVSVNVSSAPAGSLPRMHETVPVLCVGGCVQLHPAGVVNDPKVVPDGMVSAILALTASPGPALVTRMV